jgi:hypothetical protein
MDVGDPDPPIVPDSTSCLTLADVDLMVPQFNRDFSMSHHILAIFYISSYTYPDD